MKIDFSFVAVLIACLISFGTALNLYSKNRALTNEVLLSHQEYLEAAQVQEGDVLPGFYLSNLDQESAHLNFFSDGPFRLFYVVDGSDEASIKQLQERWSDVQSNSEGRMIATHVLVIDHLSSFLEQMPESVDSNQVWTANKQHHKRGYRVALVPTIVLTNPLGEVLWSENGSITDDDFQSLQTQLGSIPPRL